MLVGIARFTGGSVLQQLRELLLGWRAMSEGAVGIGSRRRLPPGPDGVQHLGRMRERPLEFLTSLVASYGDITRHEASGQLVYLLNQPDAVRHVLKDNRENYTKAGTPDAYLLTPLLGRGLLTSTGEVWERQRRMCAPAFRRSEVETFDDIMTGAARELLERWRTAAHAVAPVRVDHDLAALALTIVVRAVLGSDITGLGGSFCRAVDAVNRFMGHYVPGEETDAGETARARAEFIGARVVLDQIVHTVLAARRAVPQINRADLLALILAEHDGTSGTAASGIEIRDQVLTIVMAGHETTAKSLTWTLYLLDRYPEIAEQVRCEVDRVLGGRIPCAADIPALVICRRVIAEAMRLYPPVWLITRRSITPDEICSYDVPAGTLICISPYTLHRHAGYWDTPGEFRPERFIKEFPHHLYLPFGGGDRICIGQHFAMAEAVLVLATLLQEVRLELVPGCEVEPEALVTLRPRNGLTMIPCFR